MSHAPASRSPTKERFSRIFQFLRAFNDQHHPAPRRIAEQPWRVELSELPRHPAIAYARATLPTETNGHAATSDAADAAGENPTADDDVILTVSRPAITDPPEPPPSVVAWLAPCWDDPSFAGDVLAAEGAAAKGRRAVKDGSAFADEPARVREYRAWRKVRDAWAAREQPARLALVLFEALYALYALMEREGERHEIILGDGMLVWRRKDGDVEHPIVLQRLQLEFDPDVPAFRLRESAHPPELYGSLFSSIVGVDGRALARIRDRFSAAPCHPLGGSETSDFLGFAAVQLSPRGRLVSARPMAASDDPLIVRGPILFQRTRTLGYGTAIEAILEDADGDVDRGFSPALARIVGVDPPLPALDVDVDADAGASVAAEEILLSKPANLEQIRIAERLARYGSVLVQGPPGTGKTHTIANLIGHLLAQGKTVLVTADTTKALRVVRDQVEETLRPLCVSVLDNDLEGRRQLEEAVGVIADEISHADLDELTRRAAEKARVRAERLRALERAERELYEARADEYRPIPLGDEAIAPAEAARRVARDAAVHGWIPPPIAAGAPLPLSPDELADLYRSNATTSERDERDLRGGSLPAPADLPPPDDVDALCELIRSARSAAPRRELWARAHAADDLPELEAIAEEISRAERAARVESGHHVAVLHSGYKGGAHREPWDRLLALVDATEALSAAAQEHFVRHAPYVENLGEERELLTINATIAEHVLGGGKLGMVDLVFRPRWREYLDQATVGGRRPESPQHFEALEHLLRLREARRELAVRWDRLVRAASGPAATDLGAEIEVGAKQLAGGVASRLEWSARHYVPLQGRLARIGFAWDALLDQQLACAGPYGEVERVCEAIRTPLRSELETRIRELRAQRAETRLRAAAELLEAEGGERGAPAVASALASAIGSGDGPDAFAYRAAFERLLKLHRRRDDIERRDRLLRALEAAAPAWASAVQRRAGAHGGAEVPGDATAAWQWRQLADELDRRASRSLAELQAARERGADDLHRATSDLIEARAWIAQRKRMTLAQQQALTGWLDTQRAMGKGTGKKVPEMKAEARRLMSGCQTAVPVWIMPLSRVVESFDPREVRFDVVIIDEASQCDLLALVALYLGRQAVVVGDHEQVSPSAVGESVEASAQLVAQHLRDIPNAHLYNGRLSVYDLARQSFGGILALREHFRSVPHIIEFSNQLSYLGRILPLRDGSTAELLPTTIAYRVDGATASDKVNRAEARAVAALLIAATEQEEYASATFGVVSLLGEEQAYEVEGLLRRHLPPKEFERRRIVCGNAAHFQGDERDVMFLTLVDVADRGPLPLRDQQSFKQRFNVAASRAKNQMWVVHSLDPHADLKPDDLRRRLILHAQNAETAVRAPSNGAVRHASELERRLLEALVAAGYDARAAWPVGNYVIDIVVQGARGQGLAITCDGDRERDLDALQEDIGRQAVLERLGWPFVRVRSSAFFRDRDRAVRGIVEEIEAHGITPRAAGAAGDDATPTTDLAGRVIARARELLDSGFAELTARPSRAPAEPPRPRKRRKPTTKELI